LISPFFYLSNPSICKYKLFIILTITLANESKKKIKKIMLTKVPHKNSNENGTTRLGKNWG